MQRVIGKNEGYIDWRLEEAKGVTDYLPKWKQFIANLLGIPIRYKYVYKVIIKHGFELRKGYVVRFPINGEFHYFICKGTLNFAGFRWVLESVNPEDDIPNEKWGKNTIMQLIHRGTVNYDG